MASTDEAKTAVLEAIVGLAKEAEQYNGSTRALYVLNAAQAYRAVMGGPQPGGVVVEKS